MDIWASLNILLRFREVFADFKKILFEMFGPESPETPVNGGSGRTHFYEAACPAAPSPPAPQIHPSCPPKLALQVSPHSYALLDIPMHFGGWWGFKGGKIGAVGRREGGRAK